MRKRISFWKIAVITVGVWLVIIWIVQARQGGTGAHTSRQVLQQTCNENRADLRIELIEVIDRGIGQPFDVRVEISNGSTGNLGLADSWSYLYIDRTPSGTPDVQAFAQTSALTDTSSRISANFTVTSGHATVGWHTVSVLIDATNEIPSEGCGGENNNQGAYSFEIQGVQTPTSTDLPPPAPTSFPPPEIFLFAPEQETIGYGDAVTLRWQVAGESVSVTLDDDPVPMEAAIDKYPEESHVYILRAENPGGVVHATSEITVEEPTVTPTPTEEPCDYAIVHEFGASPSSVVRGEKVTVYWDVADADTVFLNGEQVSDVSAKDFTINRTTTFTLVAQNACGEVTEELTVQASYATATATPTPTITRTPTRTATPTPTRWLTNTPVNTPTRNVLATHTRTPLPTAGQTGTVTSTSTATATGTSSAFDSPIGTPTGTVQPTEQVTGTPSVTAIPSITTTETLTATATGTPVSTTTAAPTWTPPVQPTQTDTATPTPTTIQATPTVDPDGSVGGGTFTQTPGTDPANPTLSPTTIPPAGRIRMYLCPLAVLLIFAIGVVILSIVVPRIQERQQDMDDFGYSAALYGVASADTKETEPQYATQPPPSEATTKADGAAKQPQASLLDDEPLAQDDPFAPDEPLLDAERLPPNVSFDSLLDDLGPPEHQETERAPSASASEETT